ncbi:DUF418 domain-containing protein [uncultured Brachybacterium sp.]|uniref:DUF418 domain-containing protein n=1 Tax=uncultured Brachybacterium sp. TaxID=189680 RepID=UPI002624C663|nr:DUF418 domain-containing protein [uncultured Brachybacterium sp.]
MTSVPLSRRAGGPDLARGLALLGIALANTVGWLHGSQWTVLVKQLDATALDRAADVLIALFADNRGFPLFAMLFGYGIGILYRRSHERGESARRFMLRMLRRHMVLLVIGLAHAILLFSGDILVSYAIIGMFCVLLITRRRMVMPAVAVIALPALGVWGWADGTIGLGGGSGYASASAPDYLTGLALRAEETLRSTVLTPLLDLGLLTPMALGAIAARLRLLEEVRANRDLLIPLARWGLLIGLLGAIPLTAVLVLDPGHAHLDNELLLGILGVVHQYSGVVGALGLAAAAALLVEHLRHRGEQGAVRAEHPLGSAVRGIEALGAVSLSAYIGQSVVFLALFPPYALDLGTRLGTAGAAVIVLLTWLAMIPLADLLRTRGHRGPLERLLRFLAGASAPARHESAPGPRRGARS